ncbi:MAG TPA: hypothetical protein VK849_00125, partial [Longimicrobiales bacterium]|nr:hypothetical protein [Longimicrobiales bacterium]
RPGCSMGRRRALGLLVGAGGALLFGGPARARASGALPWRAHPDPRPDVDASWVLARDKVAPHAVELFDRIREIPRVVDGIRCHCGCGDLPDMYSLLSCYGESGMAQYCEICSGAGRIAARLHADGRSLDEIRDAIDRRFG